MIYQDAEERYANVQRIGQEVLKSAYSVLYPGSTETLDSGRLVAMNPLLTDRREVVAINGAGRHKYKDARKEYILMDTKGETGLDVPGVKGAYGLIKLTIVEELAGCMVMTNGNLRMEMKDGRIVSIYDKLEE